MARNDEGTRQSKFVIRIVCEGDKTEPLFFSDLCNAYYADNAFVDAKTIPQPYIPDEENPKHCTKRGWHKGKKRKMKVSKEDVLEPVIISGQPPLKWVQYARQLLSEGVDEAWAVYDKDEHPKHQEALDEAAIVVDGKVVNIAYSSRSFEYYLLLHFEYLYRSFLQTECGEKINGKKHIFECGTGKFPEKDCNGERCINGYARMKGYWEDTKSDNSTFPLVQDKLIKGLVNACRLRLESDSHTNAPIYERNPYTNADRLVGRIIGKYVIPFDCGCLVQEAGMDCAIRLTDNGIEFENRKNALGLFNMNQIRVYDWENNGTRLLTDINVLLQPYEKNILECHLKETQVVLIKVSVEKEFLLLPKYPK